MGRSMGGSVVGSILGSVRLYRKSAALFGLIALVLLAVFLFLRFRLQAATIPVDEFTTSTALQIELKSDGTLYAGKTRLNAEKFATDQTYRFRYQILNKPNDFIDEFEVLLTLPQSGSEATVGHRLITNGGVEFAESQLLDTETISYRATGIAPQAQVALELEVPKSFIQVNTTAQIKERLAAMPAGVWLGVSLGLPLLALLVLLLVAVGRTRKIEPLKQPATALPSRLSPALVGILLRGKIGTRELAATFLDLAQRGHVIIRQVTNQEYRFRRSSSTGALVDYEQVLLDQVFGTQAESASSEEISFSLSQEVFSKRISESFILGYEKMNELGYFYTNPLTLHRRYQAIGVIFFVIASLGLVFNLLFIDYRYSIFLFAGMLLVSMLIFVFAKGLPMRTLYGDRELARWLAFRRYLASPEPIQFAAQSQDQYLAYLPYAVIFGVEQEWTQRFYELPFAQPNWYLAANIATIDRFANSIFPIFGYLSHALYLSAEPSVR